jgi:integrase
MPLTATAVKQAKAKEKPYKLSGGKGMYLLINTNGSKYWRLKYRFAGKEKVLALGVYPDLSLSDANDKRDDARKLLAKNIDPGEDKKAQKLARVREGENLFEIVAVDWFKTKMGDKSQSHQNRVWRALEKDLFPQIGRRPINGITPPDLLVALRKIEARGAIETAHRAKQISGQVFRFAIVTGLAERDPSADLKGALKNPIKKHHAALTDPEDVSKLLIAMDSYQGTASVKAALLLSPLVFVRPGEVRHMEWDEINWEEERWELPAEKMKMKLPHIVPLSKQALKLLTQHRRLTGRGKYVFPSARGGSRPLSENGIRTALRTLGFDNDTMTPNGFRTMARTMLDEVLNCRTDYIEHQLAHVVRDTNGRAYNRTTHLKGRKEMMQDWADYLDSLRDKASGSELVPNQH